MESDNKAQVVEEVILARSQTVDVFGCDETQGIPAYRIVVVVGRCCVRGQGADPAATEQGTERR